MGKNIKENWIKYFRLSSVTFGKWNLNRGCGDFKRRGIISDLPEQRVIFESSRDELVITKNIELWKEKGNHSRIW